MIRFTFKLLLSILVSPFVLLGFVWCLISVAFLAGFVIAETLIDLPNLIERQR